MIDQERCSSHNGQEGSTPKWDNKELKKEQPKEEAPLFSTSVPLYTECDANGPGPTCSQLQSAVRADSEMQPKAVPGKPGQYSSPSNIHLLLKAAKKKNICLADIEDRWNIKISVFHKRKFCGGKNRRHSSKISLYNRISFKKEKIC